MTDRTEAAPPSAAPTLADDGDELLSPGQFQQEFEARVWADPAKALEDIAGRFRDRLTHGAVTTLRIAAAALRAAAPSSGEPSVVYDESTQAVVVNGVAVSLEAIRESTAGRLVPKWWAALSSAAAEPVQDDAPEFTLCEDTGQQAVSGACPTHRGDNCLRQFRAAARTDPANEQRLRDALTQAAHWFDEYVMAYGAKGDDARKMLNLSRARACRAAIDATAPVQP